MMRKVLTTFALAASGLAVTAPAASGAPTCPPVLRAYVAFDSPEPDRSFGQRMAFLAQNYGRDFGQQVSEEARTELTPCPS
jgi:hypothetical protein